jgi:hypothetical protein
MIGSASGTMAIRERVIVLSAAIWAAVMVALAIFQTWQVYSPIPVWDMWNGYLGFYERVSAGDWSAWWGLHNLHRIPLARLLFWADIHWFQGASIFLLAADYVLLALIATMFWRIIGDRVDEKFSLTRTLLRLLVVAWLFLLCQGENLTWAFQGQLFLVFLLPLCGFYWLQKSPTRILDSTFVFASVCGILSAGAMANGVLALPLMTAYAIVTRQGIYRVATLTLLSMLTIFLFFYGHIVFDPGLLSILASESHNITGAVLFYLASLGSPFSYIFGQKDNPYIAQAFAVIFLFAVLYKVAKAFQKRDQDLLQTALLFFVFYVLFSILALTAGRLYQGMSAALQPHHTTPAIMGWAALIVLYSADLTAIQIAWRKCLLAPALAIALLILNYQIKALYRYDDVLFERRVALLGLALGVDDQEIMRTLGDQYYVGMIPPIADTAYNERLSIFGSYPFLNAREQLWNSSSSLLQGSLPACEGFLDKVETISDARFVRVSGWLAYSTAPIEAVRLLDAGGREVGYAITGQARPITAEVATLIGERGLGDNLVRTLGAEALHAGYRGYSFSNAAGTSVAAQGENRHGALCRMNVVFPDTLFSVKPTVQGK